MRRMRLARSKNKMPYGIVESEVRPAPILGGPLFTVQTYSGNTRVIIRSRLSRKLFTKCSQNWNGGPGARARRGDKYAFRLYIHTRLNGKKGENALPFSVQALMLRQFNFGFVLIDCNTVIIDIEQFFFIVLNRKGFVLFSLDGTESCVVRAIGRTMINRKL